MPTESPQRVEELPGVRFLTEEEALAMKEDLARTRFGMSLAEFTEAWREGELYDARERQEGVISLAMMLPEYWTD